MKRREFLKGLSVAPLLPLLPKVEPESTPKSKWHFYEKFKQSVMQDELTFILFKGDGD